jgi:hypothetical protein
MPPPAVRGDVARALFYMDVRYDGTESFTTNLTLSECSCEVTSTLGNLATLLQWHEQDPPSDFERQRNELVCAEYQGNRNPFVDHPEWAAALFGGGAGAGGAADCTAACPTTAAPAVAEPATTTATSNLTAGIGSAALAPGDVAVVGFSSDNPDSLAFVFLGAGEGLPLAGGARIHFTDRGWDSGTGAFRGTSEGVLTYTAPSAGLAPGTVAVWGGADDASEDWATSGSFALSASGEQILAFADQDPAQGSGPRFLFALSYSAAPSWVAAPPAGTAAVLAAGTSTLPEGLAAAGAALALPHMDNYAFSGSAHGFRAELLAAVTSAASWVGSNTPFQVGALPYIGALAVGNTSALVPASNFKLAWSTVFDQPPTRTIRSYLGDDFNQYGGAFASSTTSYFIPENLGISDGVLTLAVNNATNPPGRPWSGSGLNTNWRHAQTFGRWEVTAQMPKGYGTTGYIGLFAADKTWPPEIDFAE